MPWWGWYATGLVSGAVLGILLLNAITIIALARQARSQN